jgi:hypothetical protein
MPHTAMNAVDTKDQQIWSMTLDLIKDDLARSTIVNESVDFKARAAKAGGKSL